MEIIYPFNIENNIDDKICIESYRNEIKERTEDVKEEEKNLEMQVNLLRKEINTLNLM